MVDRIVNLNILIERICFKSLIIQNTNKDKSRGLKVTLGRYLEPVINKTVNNVGQIKSSRFIISDHIFPKPGNPNFSLNEFLGIIYLILYMFSKSI